MANGVMDDATQIFCAEIAKGRTQVEAYRAAHPKSKANRNTMDRQAATLLRKAVVKARIVELTEKGTAKAVEAVSISKQRVLAELMDTAIRAKQPVPVNNQKGEPTGNSEVAWAASTAAFIAVGKELGMFKEASQESDPLDGLTHEEVKAVKEMLEGFVSTRDDPRPVGKPAPKRKGRSTH